MTVTIYRGHVLDSLKKLPDQSVNCLVTSPPYWSLRSYGTADVKFPAARYSPMAGLPACVRVPAMTCSLGLEPTVEAFIGHMVLIFREVRRVLRDDGTCWVNMGDSYAGNRGGGGTTASARRDDAPIPRSDLRVKGLKAKDLVGQPWRLALALQADGWWLRSDVIWAKPNPMPESTKDRPTKSHEYLFLLAKSARYYWNADEFKEACSEGTHPRLAGNGYKTPDGWDTSKGGGGHGSFHKEGREKGFTGYEHAVPGNKTHRGTQAYEDGDERHRTKGGLVKFAEKARKLAEDGSGTKNNASFDAAMAVMPATRNRRSVWTVPTQGFSEAHFATFPEDLILPCILAGCPPGGTVLDIFGGSGTTGLVADQQQRHAILCELSDEYIGIAQRRVTGDTPLLTEVMVA